MIERHLVGNDVVDLADGYAQGAHLRLRFVRRILAPAEEEHFLKARHANTLLWSFFAAKEAAYKVLCKLITGETRPILAHRRFQVSEDWQAITFETWRFDLALAVHADFVHAVVVTGGTPRSYVQKLAAGNDPSQAVRHLLVTEAARRLAVDAAELAVTRRPNPACWDGFEPPELTFRGVPANFDVSLSHDGRFVACAFLEPERALARLDMSPCGEL